MAREAGLKVCKEDFQNEMKSQQERARKAHKSVEIQVSKADEFAESTKFLGYKLSNLSNSSATCMDCISQGDTIYLIFDQSPFYAEMGGQVADTGTIEINGEKLIVTNVLKDSSGRFLHELNSSPKSNLLSGQNAILKVDLEKRMAIQRHHTATHILHWALREVLGDHIRQAGSLVQGEKLRFDFSHFEGIKTDELADIERISNEKILMNEAIEAYEIPFSEKPDEVIAFFGDKYGEFVRVVNIGGWSQELCGGTHVSTAGEIGSLRITNESAISAGTRRIEAVAGISAYKWTQERISLVQEITQTLACTPGEISSRIIQLQNKSKEQDKKLKAFQQKGQAGLADKLIESAKVLGDIKIIKAVVPETSPNDLRSLAAQINKRTVPSVVLLVSEHNGKCGLVCICSDG